MKRCLIYTDDQTFKINAYIADSFMTRFKGLMFKKKMDIEEGLLLNKCSSIHCMFMKFTIDVIYLNDEYEVVDIETVKPYRLGKINIKGCKHTLEVNENVAYSLKIGTKLNMKEQENG